MDHEMLAAIKAMMDERDDKMKVMLKEELKPIWTEITGLKGEITGMKGQITSLENRMTGVETEITGMKADITEIKQKQDDQAEYERGTRVLVEDVNRSIRLLAEGHSANAAKLQRLDRIEQTMGEVKSDTEVIKNVVSWHSDAIDHLKKA